LEWEGRKEENGVLWKGDRPGRRGATVELLQLFLTLAHVYGKHNVVASSMLLTCVDDLLDMAYLVAPFFTDALE
jgi:hypothetical protein